MSGARPGERRIAREALDLGVVHRIRGHDLFPLGPFGVADLDGDRAAEAQAMAHAAEQRHLVLLELHARAAPVAEPPAGEVPGDVFRGDGDPGGQPLQNGDQGGTVRLPGGYPAQHTRHPPTGRGASNSTPARVRARPAFSRLRRRRGQCASSQAWYDSCTTRITSSTSSVTWIRFMSCGEMLPEPRTELWIHSTRPPQYADP